MAAESGLWKDDQTVRLIELFRHNKCLYDSKNDQYHDKELKKEIIEKIADELGTISKFYRAGCISSQTSRLMACHYI